MSDLKDLGYYDLIFDVLAMMLLKDTHVSVSFATDSPALYVETATTLADSGRVRLDPMTGLFYLFNDKGQPRFGCIRLLTPTVDQTCATTATVAKHHHEEADQEIKRWKTILMRSLGLGPRTTRELPLEHELRANKSRDTIFSESGKHETNFVDFVSPALLAESKIRGGLPPGRLVRLALGGLGDVATISHTVNGQGNDGGARVVVVERREKINTLGTDIDRSLCDIKQRTDIFDSFTSLGPCTTTPGIYTISNDFIKAYYGIVCPHHAWTVGDQTSSWVPEKGRLHATNVGGIYEPTKDAEEMITNVVKSMATMSGDWFKKSNMLCPFALFEVGSDAWFGKHVSGIYRSFSDAAITGTLKHHRNPITGRNTACWTLVDRRGESTDDFAFLNLQLGTIVLWLHDSLRIIRLRCAESILSVVHP